MKRRVVNRKRFGIKKEKGINTEEWEIESRNYLVAL